MKENDWITQKRLQACLKKPTKLELKIEDFLQRHYPNEWKYVGNGQVIISGFNPDFIHCNGKKLIIEAFGDYWHKEGEAKRRYAIFKKHGYETLVIWEHESDNEDALVAKVSGFINRSFTNQAY